jgi:hypothetical protein
MPRASRRPALNLPSARPRFFNCVSRDTYGLGADTTRSQTGDGRARVGHGRVKAVTRGRRPDDAAAHPGRGRTDPLRRAGSGGSGPCGGRAGSIGGRRARGGRDGMLSRGPPGDREQERT